MNLAIIGVGRWGKNLVREFAKISDIASCYYKGNKETTAWLKKHYPHIKIAKSYQEILDDKRIEGIIVATPIKTHYEMASRALLANKHCFVEKPITNNLDQAEKLVRLAKKQNRILFVGHIFMYHPIFQKLLLLLKNDPPLQINLSWNKLGHFTEDIVWNLVCHEVSIVMGLFKESPKITQLSKQSFITEGDTISLRFNFTKNRQCFSYINRIANFKNKSVTILTGKKKIYLWENDTLYAFNRKNQLFKPIFKPTVTALEKECQEFLNCLEKKKRPYTDGEFGLKVVKLLERL